VISTIPTTSDESIGRLSRHVQQVDDRLKDIADVQERILSNLTTVSNDVQELREVPLSQPQPPSLNVVVASGGNRRAVGPQAAELSVSHHHFLTMTITILYIGNAENFFG